MFFHRLHLLYVCSNSWIKTFVCLVVFNPLENLILQLMKLRPIIFFLLMKCCLVVGQTENKPLYYRISILLPKSVRDLDTIFQKNNIKLQLVAPLYEVVHLSYERRLGKKLSAELTVGGGYLDTYIIEEHHVGIQTEGLPMPDERTAKARPMFYMVGKYFLKKVFKGFSIGVVAGYRPMASYYNNVKSNLTYHERYKLKDFGIQGAYCNKLFFKKRISFEGFLQIGFRIMSTDYVTFNFDEYKANMVIVDESIKKQEQLTGFLFAGFNFGYLF